MASTNQTTNYHLSQFVGSDKPAWLGDYNQDMSKIDTAIKGVSDTATTTATTVETHETEIDSLTSTVSTLDTTVNTLSSDVSDLKTDNTSNKSRLDALETDNTTNKSDIADLKSDNTTNKADISTLKSDMTTAQGNISTLQTNLSNTTSTANSANATATNAMNEISAISDLVVNETEIGTFLGDPLYRKVFTGTITSLTNLNIGSIADLDTCVSIRGCVGAYGGYTAIDNAYVSNIQSLIQIESSGDVVGSFGSDLINEKYVVIIEYTKASS